MLANHKTAELYDFSSEQHFPELIAHGKLVIYRKYKYKN